MHWYIRYNSKSYFVLMCQKHWYIGYSSKPYFKILRVHDMALLWIKGHSHKWKKKKKKKGISIGYHIHNKHCRLFVASRGATSPPPPVPRGLKIWEKLNFTTASTKLQIQLTQITVDSRNCCAIVGSPRLGMLFAPLEHINL